MTEKLYCLGCGCAQDKQDLSGYHSYSQVCVSCDKHKRLLTTEEAIEILLKYLPEWIKEQNS